MDDALVHAECIAKKKDLEVLILVLMDDALVRAIIFKFQKKDEES